MERHLTTAVAWGEHQHWQKEDPKKGWLEYLQSILRGLGIYSKSRGGGPDDTSPFGAPVYLKDMNALEMREYLLSGMSKKEQDRIFSCQRPDGPS